MTFIIVLSAISAVRGIVVGITNNNRPICCNHSHEDEDEDDGKDDER
jgi:hypothetical protein